MASLRQMAGLVLLAYVAMAALPQPELPPPVALPPFEPSDTPEVAKGQLLRAGLVAREVTWQVPRPLHPGLPAFVALDVVAAGWAPGAGADRFSRVLAATAAWRGSLAAVLRQPKLGLRVVWPESHIEAQVQWVPQLGWYRTLRAHGADRTPVADRPVELLRAAGIGSPGKCLCGRGTPRVLSKEEESGWHPMCEGAVRNASPSTVPLIVRCGADGRWSDPVSLGIVPPGGTGKWSFSWGHFNMVDEAIEVRISTAGVDLLSEPVSDIPAKYHDAWRE